MGEHTRIFQNFRGIDVTSELGQVADVRFAYAENMYKDYESGQGMSVETFPGHRLLARFKDRDTGESASIYGMYMYKSIKDSKKYIVVHAGKCLYRFAHDKRNEFKDLTPIYTTMEENHSTGFLFNNRLYILDGKNYICVDENGSAANVDEDNAYVPTTYSNGLEYEQRNMLTNKFIERQYISTMSPNQLSSSSSSNSYEKQSKDGIGIICGIYNRYYGDSSSYYKTSLTVYPTFSKVEINFDELYNSYYNNFTTKNAGTPAKGKEKLEVVKMYDTVETIDGTFDECSKLTSLTLSNNIKKLDAKFFAGTGLTTVYLPAGLNELGEDAFVGCSKLTEIYCSDEMYEELTTRSSAYGLVREIIKDETTETETLEVIGEDETTTDESNIDEQVIYKVKLTDGGVGTLEIKIKKYSENLMTGVPAIKTDPSENRIYIHTPCESIEKICVGKAKIVSGAKISYIPYRQYINGKTYIIAVDFYNSAEESINDYIYVYGNASSSNFTTSDKYIASLKGEDPPLNEEDKSIFGNTPDYKGTSKEAINNCNVTTVFDDRIFFTGNENLPNTVFYTQRDQTGHTNPTYVGILNYFNDGVGNVRNSAMMSNAMMLMVLKGDTAQDGSIFYHSAQSTDNDITPRIYPSVEGVPGLGCTGVAVNFRDDCVFLSKRGLEAVAKQTVNLERTVQHRSTNIDALFKGKDLTKARAAEWCGYLLILIDGELYLADSRQMFEGIGGAIEYEWYYCKDIGDYVGDNDKYYTERPLKPLDEGICVYDGRIAVDYNSVRGREGMQYAEIDGIKYFVVANAYETEDGKTETEKENGTLNKATEILCVDDVLYFGTTSGGILCLNNDKRDDFGRIPEEMYNRCGHAYPSILQLKLDNAGVPYYTKNTVKRSPTFNLKPFKNSSVKISVSTDRIERTLIAEQSNNILDFDAFDFSNTAMQQSDRSIFVIKERTKKWVEKQYDISSERHNAPFGIYSLAYRYEIAGRIKK